MKAPYQSTVTLLLALLFAAPVIAATSEAPINPQDLESFVKEMEKEHLFDAGSLQTLMAEAAYQQKIIDAISRPAEGKAWHQYRPIFLTEARITQGVEFLQKNRRTLQKAEQQYGVPAEIITAIIGVETFYGRHAGSYRVIDALTTLAFAYPKRAPFFRQQLKEFLLMSREESIDPLSLMGSYAGAMGLPQFIPSSFRSYAIDFDNSGKRDLWQSEEDAIGSVANYLARHRWQRGEKIALRAKVEGDRYQPLIDKGYEPSFAVKDLLKYGVVPEWAISATDNKIALIALEQPEGFEHWLVFNNFYAITRYNHSPLYAMAVFQLSEAIRSSSALTLPDNR
ncbi:MAG: lytic murein transglycosylase B [Gammaproteobacteria bacterium]|nr:lytic murein transglycosylase B [Gammaproteobacteria bacterium]